jgi:geranylgeranyl diphosphate synthase type II
MFEQYKLEIENHLLAIEFPDEPAELYEPIKYILSLGGKRIRPILVLLGAELFNDSKDESLDKAIPAALAVELFHNFSLLHDDIMDEAPLRRGKPTVHKKWNQNVAILSGDNLLIWAYKQLLKCEPSKLPGLLEVFNEMAQEVCEGQQRDMQFERTSMVSREAYIDMIRQKTAVLLGAALKMGAMIANASIDDAEQIYQFGINIGIAFQLQDDILDTFGNSAEFGKQIGGDVLANKKTILLVEAFNRANDAQKLTFEKLMAVNGQVSKDVADKKIFEVTQLYRELGILDVATELMQFYVDQANINLKNLSISVEKGYNLSILAQSLLTRSK